MYYSLIIYICIIYIHTTYILHGSLRGTVEAYNLCLHRFGYYAMKVTKELGLRS